MSEIDLIHHIAAIEQHLWVLRQSSPHSELRECTQLLQSLTNRLLKQNALTQPSKVSDERINAVNEICEIYSIPQKHNK